MYSEVTLRLANGSVVVVENVGEVEEPYFVPGSSSYELAQRLDQAGYYRHNSKNNGKPKSDSNLSCYPGQRVQTKKALVNFRILSFLSGILVLSIYPKMLTLKVTLAICGAVDGNSGLTIQMYRPKGW